MRYRILEPNQNVIAVIGDLLLAERENCENCLVLFPGIRPVYFLRKYLAQKHGAMRAPKMLSIDGFVSENYTKLCPQGRLAAGFDLLALLLEQLKGNFSDIFEDSQNSGAADFLLPLAQSLIEEMEELKTELIKPKDLLSYNDALQVELQRNFFPSAFADINAGEHSQKNEKILSKIQKFSLLYEQFYSAVDRAGYTTKAGTFAWLAEHISEIDLSKFKKIFIVGFLRMTRSEKKIMLHLEKAGAEFFFVRNLVLSKYINLPNEEISTPETQSNMHFIKAADLHGEVYKLRSILEKSGSVLKTSVSDNYEKDVIVVPDAKSLFPLLLNGLPENTDCNVSMACSITVSPLYSMYEALMNLFTSRTEQGYLLKDYLTFLKHPYIKNLACGEDKEKNSAENGRIVVQEFEKYFSGSLIKYFLPSEDIKITKAGISAETISKHLRTIYCAYVLPFEHIESISDFCAKLRHCFNFTFEQSTAKQHKYWLEFYSALIGAIDELKNSKLAQEKLTDTIAYFRFFSLIMLKLNYPFSGTPVKGLQILGPLETRSLNFENVFYLDANADVLPQTGRKAKVLSDFIRRSLGLITRAERDDEARFHFENLINSAKNVYLFYKDSSEKEKSPFVEKLIWLKEKKGEKALEEPVFFSPSFTPKSIQSIEKTSEILNKLKNISYSPSSLDEYLECGLRFFYSHCLEIKEENSYENLEAKDIGKLVHSVLEIFFSSKLGKALSIDSEDFAKIENIAEEQVTKLFGYSASGSVFLFKRQLFRRLSNILHFHMNMQNTEIKELERNISAEIKTKFGTAALFGRADRIEKRDGEIVILDYKTGSAKIPDLNKFSLEDRKNWSKTLKSVQLPFYIYASEKLFSGCKNAALLLLGAEPITEKLLYTDKTLAERDEKQAILTEAIRMLISEIFNADMPFTPTEDSKNCQFCPYAVSCGRM